MTAAVSSQTRPAAEAVSPTTNLDKVAVAAPTSTTLTLARTTADFGQDVAASATVTSSSGRPVGEVGFTVDGVATGAKVGEDGVASLELPDSPVGSHTVWATFVPSDVSAFSRSTSVTKLLLVSKAETKAQVQATGRTTTTVTRVAAKMEGAFGTVPTGQVRITLKRLGTSGRWVKSKSLDGAGAAKARLGKLAKGRYRVVVLYRGDANHLDARKTTTFRVAQGR